MKNITTEQLKKFENLKISNPSAIKGGASKRVSGAGASVRSVQNVA